MERSEDVVILGQIPIHPRIELVIGVAKWWIDSELICAGSDGSAAARPHGQDRLRNWADRGNQIVGNRIRGSSKINLMSGVIADPAGESFRAERREVAVTESIVWHCHAGAHRAAVIPDPDVVREEKQLVLNDRPTDAASVLVIVVRALAHLWVFEIISRVEILVAIVFIR